MMRFESARFEGNGYFVELKSRDWTGPVVTRLNQHDHRLYLSLPPIVYRGDIRFQDFPDTKRIRIGRSVYYPAGRLMEIWGTGGTAYSIGCTITPERFERILGFTPNWGIEQLERGCNLDRSPVLAILAHLAQEMRLPEIGHAAQVEALTTRAVVELARYLGSRTGEEESGKLSTQQMQRISERLIAEELGPPTVAELAQICSVSERHLLRLFHATTGTTVSAHIRAALIDRARAMLEEGRPIKQIAHALGFSGPSSFSLAFRKITGISPAIWRSDRQNMRAFPFADD